MVKDGHRGCAADAYAPIMAAAGMPILDPSPSLNPEGTLDVKQDAMIRLQA